jgi:hypothetical protein
MTRPDCPWYLSARAVTEFARILYLDPEVDADFDRAEDLLVEVARSAKSSRNQTNGLQLWVGLIPLSERGSVKIRATEAHALVSRDVRLQLLVSTTERPEGELPQLVSVELRGRR